MALLMLFQTQALQRKLVLTQDELKRSESKLSTTSKDLEEASDRTNAIAKAIKILESKNMIDEGSKYILGAGRAAPTRPESARPELFSESPARPEARFSFKKKARPGPIL